MGKQTVATLVRTARTVATRLVKQGYTLMYNTGPLLRYARPENGPSRYVDTGYTVRGWTLTNSQAMPGEVYMVLLSITYGTDDEPTLNCDVLRSGSRVVNYVWRLTQDGVLAIDAEWTWSTVDRVPGPTALHTIITATPV